MKPRILIINDAPADIAVLVGILTPFCDIHIAYDYKKGLEIAAVVYLDLIMLKPSLSDATEPQLASCEILEKLKTDERTQNIPMVFLEGSKFWGGEKKTAKKTVDSTPLTPL